MKNHKWPPKVKCSILSLKKQKPSGQKQEDFASDGTENVKTEIEYWPLEVPEVTGEVQKA